MIFVYSTLQANLRREETSPQGLKIKVGDADPILQLLKVNEWFEYSSKQGSKETCPEESIYFLFGKLYYLLPGLTFVLKVGQQLSSIIATVGYF